MKQFPMVDATPQLRAVLEDLDVGFAYSVSEGWPRKAPSGPLITIQEITNQNTQIPVVDQLAWQVDLWARERDSIRSLAAAMDQALTGLGLRRSYAGPEEVQDRGGGYYRKIMRYGRNVDKRTLRLVD